VEVDVTELNKDEDEHKDKGACEYNVRDPAWTLLRVFGWLNGRSWLGRLFLRARVGKPSNESSFGSRFLPFKAHCSGRLLTDRVLLCAEASLIGQEAKRKHSWLRSELM